MEFEYEVTIEDMVESAVRVHRKGKSYSGNRWKSSFWAAIGTWILIGFLGSLGSQIERQAGLIAGGVLAVVAGVGQFLAYEDIVRRRLRKYFTREYKDKMPIRQKFTVQNDRITGSSGNTEIVSSFSNLISLSEDKYCIELDMGPNQGISVIPRKAFSSPEQECEFLQFAKEAEKKNAAASNHKPAPK